MHNNEGKGGTNLEEEKAFDRILRFSVMGFAHQTFVDCLLR